MKRKEKHRDRIPPEIQAEPANVSREDRKSSEHEEQPLQILYEPTDFIRGRLQQLQAQNGQGLAEIVHRLLKERLIQLEIEVLRQQYERS